MTRSRWMFAAKLAVGLAILAWLLMKADARAVLQSLLEVRFRPFTASVLLLLASTGLQATRLHLLTRAYSLSFAESLRLTMGTYFFNQLLPGGVGGDAYRAVGLKRHMKRWIPALGVTGVDRLAGGATLLIPAAIIAAAPGGRLMSGRGSFAKILTAPLAILAITIAAAAATAALIFFRQRLLQVLRELTAAMAALAPSTWLGVIAVSLVYHAVRAVSLSLLVMSVGGRISLSAAVLVLAGLLFSALVPVSPGALGIKEAVLTGSLVYFGLGSSQAAAVAVLNRALLVAIALSGAVPMLAPGRKAAAGLSAPEPDPASRPVVEGD